MALTPTPVPTPDPGYDPYSTTPYSVDWGVTDPATSLYTNPYNYSAPAPSSGSYSAPAPAPTTSTGLDPHINPATGVWDDTYYAETYGGGGGGGGESEADRLAREAREAIESGYSAYFAELDTMLNEGLPAQKTAQEGIVSSQYQQGVGELGEQREEGLGMLGKERERTQTGQARNLKDISANLRNAFMAGNVFLGARGAGDSSAANMYSYALTKLGSKQRGDIMTKTADIMSEIGDREARLQNIYTSEVNKLSSERDQKILSISSWFAEQLNAIRQAKATGEISKGQDLASLSQNLLNIAIQKLNAAQQEASNRRAALEQWAMNNSQTIQQLRANMQGIQSYSPNLPQSQPIVGQPSISPGGSFNVPSAYYPGSGTKEEEKSIFGGGTSGGYGASGSW